MLYLISFLDSEAIYCREFDATMTFYVLVFRRRNMVERIHPQSVNHALSGEAIQNSSEAFPSNSMSSEIFLACICYLEVLLLLCCVFAPQLDLEAAEERRAGDDISLLCCGSLCDAFMLFSSPDHLLVPVTSIGG
jgi:hypothetical protein